MNKKRKNIPCEGCRDRKKKCNSGRPCERCKRLRIECIYLESDGSTDYEYFELVNSSELEANVKYLSHCMNDLEEELQRLVFTFNPITSDISHCNCVDKITEITDRSGTIHIGTIGNRCHSSSHNNDVSFESHQLTTIKSLDGSSSRPLSWDVWIRKNGLRIETHIQSFNDLMRQIQMMHRPMLFGDSMAFVKQPSYPGPYYLNRQTLFSILRDGYFNAVQQCTVVSNNIPPVLSNHLEPTPELTLLLVETYFSCQFFQSAIFHRQTFFNRFVDRLNPTSSAVVCALCAVVLTMRCHHIRQLVPDSKQIRLGAYYIRRARDLIAFHFDDTTYEVLVTYALMALYYAQLMRPDETQRYLDMALRIKYIMDSNGPLHVSEGEWETYKRVHGALVDAARFVDFIHNQRGVAVRKMDKIRKTMPSYADTLELDVKTRHTPSPLPDEPPEVVRAIKAKIYSEHMLYLLGAYLKIVRFQEGGPMAASLFHKTEAAVKEFYFVDLPPEYRLSLDIFENSLTCDEFRRRLSNVPNCDMASLHVAIQYHQAILSIHEPLLKRLPTNHTLTLDSFSEQEQVANDGLAETYALRSQEICHREAIIIIRLLEYLMATVGSCNLLMPCFLTAYDIHLRNSCLDTKDPGKENTPWLSKQTIQESREYLVRCINIIRKGYCYNAAEQYLWQHHQTVENQLLDSMFTASLSVVGDV